MNFASDKLLSALNFAKEVALETVWPTRCCVCDMPGEKVLCDECASNLRFIDSCLACPVCGAPYGIRQCTECNDATLRRLEMDTLPLDEMTSVVDLDDAARRIVAIYKDSDERRLCNDISQMMLNYMKPEIKRGGYVITYIPDTAKAFRRRGFDHAMEIAQTLACKADMECLGLFERPKSFDQRKLSARQRIANMQGRLQVCARAQVPEKILVVDDVCTTGATIFAAASALQEAGASYVSALTFGRVIG